MRIWLGIALVVIGMIIPPSAQGVAQFNVKCEPSHSAFNDPIVFPNRQGASHLHEFTGNTTTDQNSTFESLQAGSTTCSRPLDLASYWQPAIYKNGVRVPPEGMLIYYRGAQKEQNFKVQPFPDGLKVLAGNSKATKPQSASIITWQCESSFKDTKIGAVGTTPRTQDQCETGDNLTVKRVGQVASVKFPDCWDGQNLDSENHKSHMQYSVVSFGIKQCPLFWIPVPQIEIKFHTNVYAPLQLAAGNELFPSLAPDYILHADFFNAWVQSELKRLIDNCINMQKDCGGGG